jgi:GTP-binding protein
LAINKCDNPSGDANRWDFAVLGLGEPFTFSALNGRSTGEMLDHAIEPLRDQDEEPEDPRLKIAVVGRPNAGKSSLVNALLGQERMIVTPIAGTTRDAIDSVIKHYGEEVVLIDTAGLRRRSRVTENIELYSIIRTQGAIERCDVAVVMIDAEIGMEHQDKRIIADVIEQRKGIIIAVNKWDIIEKDHRTADEYAKKMREEFATADYAPIIFISALTKQRITKIIEMAKDIQLRRTTRISTSKLNDWMEPIIEKQPPPAVNARDLRINYVTQVKVAPPTFAFFLNHPELLPDSYKRFMERRMRDAFDLEGVPVSFLFKRKNVKREDE